MGNGERPDEELWTTGQAAAHLRDVGVSRRQVYRMVESGELPALQRAGHAWHRLPASAVRAYRQRMLAQLGEQRPAETDTESQ